MKQQFIAIRWGKKYGPEYLNRLYGMVARNINPPFEFFCLTDDSAGIRPEVTCLPLPDLGCELPTNTKGIWGKSRLWSPDLGGPTGALLFLDLDIVVTGRLTMLVRFSMTVSETILLTVTLRVCCSATVSFR